MSILDWLMCDNCLWCAQYVDYCYYQNKLINEHDRCQNWTCKYCGLDWDEPPSEQAAEGDKLIDHFKCIPKKKK